MRGPVQKLAGEDSCLRIEKRVLRASVESSGPRIRRCDKRYRPEDRCNGCFRYSSDVHYKRQTLPPYRQRSTEFAERVEILNDRMYNRYKPQSLTLPP